MKLSMVELFAEKQPLFRRTRWNGPVPNELKVITEQIITPDACKRIYGRRITPGMHCAGLAPGGIGPYHGDSGGPLVVRNVLLGIVSWGWGGCAHPGFPGVFARVPFYVNWIHENM